MEVPKSIEKEKYLQVEKKFTWLPGFPANLSKGQTVAQRNWKKYELHLRLYRPKLVC